MALERFAVNLEVKMLRVVTQCHLCSLCRGVQRCRLGCDTKGLAEDLGFRLIAEICV
jgi:hypothetical protein